MKDTFVIEKPRLIKKPIINKNTLLFPIQYSEEKYDIYIDYYNLPNSISISKTSEGIVALFYVISLYNNLNLEVYAKTDTSLIQNLNKIQPYFSKINQNKNCR